MSSLARQQAALLEALWQPRHADAIETIAPHVRPAGTAAVKQWERGLQAYRSNGQALAQRVLAAAYPVVAQLLGEENFQALARRLWQQHPPGRGDLAQWGAQFAAMLAATADLAREEPYLPDVARTEWALHEAGTAADGMPDPASFSLFTEGDPAHLTGEPPLEEAGRLLQNRIGETALVWRQGLTPRLRPAQAGEPAFIAALLANASLLDALAAAPALDFNAWLAPAVQQGLLIGCAPCGMP